MKPRQFTKTELTTDVAEATLSFRSSRQDEPADLWTSTFATIAKRLRRFFVDNRFTAPQKADAGLVRSLVVGGFLEEVRYSFGPVVSDDDLRVWARCRTLSPKTLADDGDGLSRIAEILRSRYDVVRFPWTVEDREPTDTEMDALILSTGVLMANQKVLTGRRNQSKTDQENAVAGVLNSIPMSIVERRRISVTLDRAPQPGEYCRESKLGTTRGDFIVRLYDWRLLPMECKVSNSAVNSFKRVNHEALGKARKWLHEFGEGPIVPGVVLSGVFNPDNLWDAQEAGLNLFWSHRLDDLKEFILATRG